MTCLFCDNNFSESSEEHIVPESLGNIHYILPSNIICQSCNTSFSEFEKKSISKSVLAFFRIRNGVKTKKGKPSSMQIGNIKGIGDNNFQKNIIKIEGLEEENIE